MDTHNKQLSESLKQQIRLEEIRLLYGGTPWSFTAAVVIALIIYIVLKGHVTSDRNLTIWLSLMISVMFIRSIDSYQFANLSKQRQEQTRWRIRFFIGTGIAGFCWGLLPWLGYPLAVEYFSFIIVCLVGVVAGSLSTLSYRWETLALFLLPSSLLLIARLVYDDQTFSNATSIVLLVFIFFSLSAGKRIFDNTQQNLRLTLEARNREHALQLMHQKQALHLQNTPLAIIEFDIDLNVSEWNKAAESIFGYSREEALNENIISLILPRDSSTEAEKLWQRLLNYEAVAGTVIENKTKSGEIKFCQWFITPLTDEKNDIAGIAAMALDITDKKYHELATIKSKEEAEKANRAKSDFLSMMSHELRTPLNAILGFTQLLSYEKNLSEKQFSHINEISNAGSMLLELVDQILDLARIEKGHLQLSIEKVNLSAICTECHAMVSPLAKQNDISLHLESSINGHVYADYTRLKQVLLNLLSNAIKYNSDYGSVTIKIRAKEKDVIRISITDTGKGITKELIKNIFQPFNRLNAASNIEGTGIGLSISKELIKMMHGTIGVTSRLNIGSEFWIELPGRLNNDTDADISGKDEQASTSELITRPSKHNILVAEDNPTNQILILNQLESLGYSADLVNNGQEALDKLSDNNYHLLLTDCNMPIVDGYELAQQIRNKGNTTLPIIALTADAFPEKKTKCLQAGMNEQLTKPVDLNTLKYMIDKYLI